MRCSARCLLLHGVFFTGAWDVLSASVDRAGGNTCVAPQGSGSDLLLEGAADVHVNIDPASVCGAGGNTRVTPQGSGSDVNASLSPFSVKMVDPFCFLDRTGCSQSR